MILLLGQAGGSRVRELDPRVKAAWLVAVLVTAVAFRSPWIPPVLLALLALASALGRISFRVFLPFVQVAAVIGFQFILLQGFLRQEGPVLAAPAGIPFHWGGVTAGLEGMLLLVVVMGAFLQFLLWTSPEDLSLLLVFLRLPPAYAVLVGLAVRFLPVMERDLRAIREARQCRGLELGTRRQKLKGFLSVALPLVLRTLRRGDDVALAMELKGYRLHRDRTFMKRLRLSRGDRVALAACGGIFAVLWVLGAGM